MNNTIDRRGFLRLAAITAGGGSLSHLAGMALSAAEAAKSATSALEKLGWSLCCQLYTFRSVSFYEAIDTIASLGIRSVEPCFFLRLDKDRPALKTNEELPAELRKEMKRRLADRGMRMINYYASLGNDSVAARKVFDFAKEMDAKTIIAEPPAEAFDMIEKLCDEYEINLAVHNHPKSATSKYWRPENLLTACKGRSKRIGACCDTGHWVRSGLKPVDCLKKMKDRIISLHVKDVGEWGKPSARDVPLGTGLSDFTAVLRELHHQRFRGVLAIEYEHQSAKLVDEVTQCIDFVEKTARSLAG